jgi:integrase/recombinase XerC
MIELFLEYIQKEKRFSHHTFVSYRTDLSQFNNYLEGTYSNQFIEQATSEQIRSWIMDLAERELSATTINRKIATLHSFFKFLVFRGVIEHNPTLNLKPLKKETRLPAFVKEDEVIRLLDHIQFTDDFDGLRDQLMLELFYATGIRLTELINIQDNDINHFQSTLKVLGKRNKERILPVSKALVALTNRFVQLKRKEGFMTENLLVTDKGAPLYPMFVYRKVQFYLNQVTSLTKKSPHIIRHSFATHMLNKGADLNAVKELLGHTSLAATQVYTHNSIEKLRDVFKQAHPKA